MTIWATRLACSHGMWGEGDASGTLAPSAAISSAIRLAGPRRGTAGRRAEHLFRSSAPIRTPDRPSTLE